MLMTQTCPTAKAEGSAPWGAVRTTWQSVGQEPRGSWLLPWTPGQLCWMTTPSPIACLLQVKVHLSQAVPGMVLAGVHWHRSSYPLMDAELPPTHPVGGGACAKPERPTKQTDLLQHTQPTWERCTSCGNAGPFPVPVAVNPPV